MPRPRLVFRTKDDLNLIVEGDILFVSLKAGRLHRLVLDGDDVILRVTPKRP